MLNKEEIIYFIEQGLEWLIPAVNDELLKQVKEELGLWKRYLKS